MGCSAPGPKYHPPTYRPFPHTPHQTAPQCLHRFCKDCAELAVRKFSAVENDTRAQPASRRKQAGGAECPLCRTNIASRRDL